MKDLASDINMSKACRVCLTEEKNMKSLFSVEQVLEKDIEISDILMACSSISVERTTKILFPHLLTQSYVLDR